MTITEGAKLIATLAQGVGIGDITLLKATTHTGDFADEDVSHQEEGVEIPENNMYKFEKKEGEFGVFTIKKKASAQEIAEQASGQHWVGVAAGAWVDGPAFDEKLPAHDVADKLAALAQNDAFGLVRAIKTLAPTETPVVETNSTEITSRLFRTVDGYLRGELDPMGFASGDDLDGVRIWGKAYVGESKIGDHGKIAGFNADSHGFILGWEKKLNRCMKVGAGLQFDSTDISAYGRGIDTDTLTGFVYSDYKPSDWFIDWVLAYGGSNYDEKKYALGSRYKAEYDVHTASVAMMTGYQFKYFTPEFGFRYYHIKQNAYQDTANQQVGDEMFDILRGVAGIRFAKDFGIFYPDVYFGLTYDLINDKDNAAVTLANGTGYVVPGKRLYRLGYEATTSINAYITDHISASISYMGAYRKDYQEHTGMLSLKYSFQK